MDIHKRNILGANVFKSDDLSDDLLVVLADQLGRLIVIGPNRFGRLIATHRDYIRQLENIATSIHRNHKKIVKIT
jgi:hypothetical protein